MRQGCNVSFHQLRMYRRMGSVQECARTGHPLSLISSARRKIAFDTP
jgi:hypothetical protein